MNKTLINRSIFRENQPDWVWDHFEQTPIMSTFTVGFVVSEFIFIERNKTEDDKEMGRAQILQI